MHAGPRKVRIRMIQSRTRQRQSLIRKTLACVLVVAVAGWILPWNAAGQVQIPADAVSGLSDVQRVLQAGKQFEQQQRWGDALMHYEEAIKAHPESSELEQRHTLARIHYNLTRRYHDKSFIKAVQTLSTREALDVYGEVLLKIHSHYVQAPDWEELVRLGSTQLNVALGQELFVEQHLTEVSSDDITAFRGQMSRMIAAQHARDRHEARHIVARIADMAQRRLQLAPAAVILEFTSGATSALDTYSSFLTPDQLEEVFSQIEGNFVGLGIELKLEEHALLVVNVIRGGPADRAGLAAQDRIVAVDGQSTQVISSEAAADLLKGPEGSAVAIVVRDPRGVERTMRVTRKRVDVPSVEGVRLVDPRLGVGYMRLTSFQKTTSRDVDAALWKLYRQGMRSLIVDVRGNPGGLLNASVEIADKFVTEGKIVSTRGRSHREDYDYRAKKVGTWRVPLVVLIDHDSASASEIFAAAIHDHGRGTVVGQRSYGKGSVQGIFPLATSKAGLRLTTAKFFSPKGRAISRQGVQPHLVVRTVAKPATDGAQPADADKDAALDSAVQTARQLIARR